MTMENKIDDGGPAYPVGYETREVIKFASGITKREYFRSDAIKGILSGCPQGLSALDITDKTIEAWVGLADRIAVAMIKAGKEK